jgi:hypothetical protein
MFDTSENLAIFVGLFLPVTDLFVLQGCKLEVNLVQFVEELLELGTYYILWNIMPGVGVQQCRVVQLQAWS